MISRLKELMPPGLFWLLAAVLLGGIIIVLLPNGTKGPELVDESSVPPKDRPVPRPTFQQERAAREEANQLTYRVSGRTREAEIQYTNETGGTDTVTASGPDLPAKEQRPGEWRGWLSDQPLQKSVTIPDGKVAYLLAQIPNEADGENIKVEILFQGQVVQAFESNGRYAAARVAVRR